MSALGDRLSDYVRLRRALGFQLGRHGESLPGFVAFVEANGAVTITVELAVAWARLPQGIKPITVDFRLSAVRGFARYLHALDPAHQIPPAGLLSVPRRRPTPYIYAPGEIAEVLAAARRLRPPLRAATQTALLGLLAATGMRSGEAMALSRADVDLVEGVITVRHAEFDRMRLVPLHPSVTSELRDYATTRDRLCRTPSVDRFFVSVTGRALHRRETDAVFRDITASIGLRTDTVHPRVHDLRHAFAVRTLIDAHRNGTDISTVLPVLSTYLGHVEPAAWRSTTAGAAGGRTTTTSSPPPSSDTDSLAYTHAAALHPCAFVRPVDDRRLQQPRSIRDSMTTSRLGRHHEIETDQTRPSGAPSGTMGS